MRRAEGSVTDEAGRTECAARIHLRKQGVSLARGLSEN